MRMLKTVAGRLGRAVSHWSRAAVPTARRHWLVSILLLAGLVLRIITQITYRPALFYIDTVKYLFGAYPGNDPPGYLLLLKPFMKVADFDTVAAIQHLLGLGMAVAIYALLVHKGCARWLAALATAPILLDAYQLQMEQTVMPDVVFEALMVAGMVVLIWRSRPNLWQLAIAGVLLGSTATFWEPGEILILPALVYALIVATGWRGRLGHVALICVAFAAPILLICYRNYVDIKHFSLAPYAPSTIYGRMAYAADCQTLKLPAYERPLCPPRQLALSLGPDNLDHSDLSPLKHYIPPRGMSRHSVASNFSERVLEQQPLRVIGSILSDSIKLFEVHRVTSAGDTPISRWQFQNHFPSFYPYDYVHDGQLKFGYYSDAGVAKPLGVGEHFGGGNPRVIVPLAKFLRAYQLDGGYTPGPLLLFLLLAALAGSAVLLRRRKNASKAERDAAWACFYVIACGVLVLLLSDTFEFSWRYQLPALITLPPAGFLGVSVLIGYLGSLRGGRAAAQTPVTADGPPAITADDSSPVAADGQPPVAEESLAAVEQPGTEPGSAESAEDREPQGKNHASAG
jgi:hypothetical protein